MSSSTSNYHFSQVSQISNDPPLIIAFASILVVGFILAFCAVHFSMCFKANLRRPTALEMLVRHTASASASASTSPNRNGLDPLLLENFPSFPYSSVKEYCKEKHGLDCAICLSEFKEDSLLRLLTICCHVFHQECIDLWLTSHKSCPVCRRELDSPTTLKEKLLEPGDIDGRRSDSQADTDDVRADVKDTEDDGSAGEREKQETSDRKEREGAEEDHMEKVLRAHSTGHSIIMIRGEEEDDKNDMDKYTLRLPEDVKVKLFSGGHHRYARSWANS